MMGDDNFQSPSVGDRLYADAVCAQCSTVNPEGTLICKTCGNNLRDQRTLRLTAEQQLVGQAERVERRQFLLGALTVLGILLILWTTLNVDTITHWLIAMQGPAFNVQRAFWSGPDNDVFTEMLAEVESRRPSPEEIQAAMQNPVLTDSFEGIYIIVRGSGLIGARPVGVGRVKQFNGEYYFVARVGESGEVRGRAMLQSNSLSAGWENAGASDGARYFSVAGVALRRPDGTFDCFGQSAIAEEGYEFMAYRLPQ